VKTATTDENGKVNVAANALGHALAGGLVAYLQGNSAPAAQAIMAELYPNKKVSELTEEQKQTISALSSMAAGLAGAVAGNSGAGGAVGVVAGKNAVENNALGDGWSSLLPSGTLDYGKAVGSWNQYAVDNNLTPEQTQAGLDKLAKGDLPEGADITKVIVNGYKDGVLIAGAAYLGPAASVGKVVGGAVIGAIANGSYQWFDMSQPGSENKSWDYKGSVSAGITGALAPGRGVWQNVGMAAGGAVFTDGPDIGSIGGAAAGAWAGGVFGVYAPKIVNSVTGKEIPGFVYDYWGGVASEFSSGFIKDLNKPKDTSEEKKQ